MDKTIETWYNGRRKFYPNKKNLRIAAGSFGGNLLNEGGKVIPLYQGLRRR